MLVSIKIYLPTVFYKRKSQVTDKTSNYLLYIKITQPNPRLAISSINITADQKIKSSTNEAIVYKKSLTNLNEDVVKCFMYILTVFKSSYTYI